MRVIRRFLALLLVLAVCLPAMPGFAADSMPTVRIWLKRIGLTDRADLWLNGRYTVTVAGSPAMSFPKNSKIVLQAREGNIYLYYAGMAMNMGSSVRLVQNQKSAVLEGICFSEKGNIYPGDMYFTVSNGMLNVVLTIGTEDYLMGVVPYEMSDSYPIEALKAQAVCARTYALKHIDPSKSYDMVDTTDNQVFSGINPGNTNAIRAVKETAGVVVANKEGKLATCYYAASNGGQMDTVAHVWGTDNEDNSYYRMGDDPYDLENPESVVKRFRMKKNGSNIPPALTALLQNKLKSDLARNGFDTDDGSLRVDRVNAVTFSAPRHTDSRVMTAVAIDFNWSGRKSGSFVNGGIASVQLPVFPDALTALELDINGSTYNELLSVWDNGDEFVIESRRFGHGLGMSQRGAQWMAQKYGFDFVGILSFYYPGTSLMRAPFGDVALPTVPGWLANTPAPPATPTPRPTLMPVDAAGIPAGGWLASVEGIEDDSSLNLRAQPNGAATILMRIYKHQQLVVIPDCPEEGWVHVRTDGIEGYVMERFLEKVN